MIGAGSSIFHIVQGLLIFLIARIHLAGCRIIAPRFIHPATAIADGPLQEVPLGIVIVVIGQQRFGAA